MRILLTGARAPAALHLAKLLHQGGATIIAADCIRWPLTRGADFVEKTVRHPAPAQYPEDFCDWLQKIIRSEGIDLVVPSCEEVLHLSQAMEALNLQHKLYAPSFTQLRDMHSKHRFIEVLQSMGLNAPATSLIASTSDLEALGPKTQEMVLKPVWSRFAARVIIRPNAVDVEHLEPTESDPWIAQEVLEGQEVCIYAVGHEGKLGGWTAYQPKVRVGQGAGIHFDPIYDPRIEGFLEAFFQKTTWTGQVSFDAFLTPSGNLVPIECNPRATSGIHFITDAQAFAKAMRGEKCILRQQTHPLQVSEAMLIFGLPAALMKGRLPQWISAWRTGKSAACYTDSQASGLVKVTCFLELVFGALRKRKSLLAGSTEGIEWNGYAHREKASQTTD